MSRNVVYTSSEPRTQETLVVHVLDGRLAARLENLGWSQLRPATATTNGVEVLESGRNPISNTEVRVRTHPLLVLLLAVALPIACPAQQPERKHFKSKLAVQRHLPFSSAVLVGNMLYIAGTTGVSPENAGKPLSAEAEARSVM